MIENIVPESALVNEKLKEELISFFHKLEEEIILKAVIDMEKEKVRELAGFLAVIATLNKKIYFEAYSEKERECVPELDATYLPVVGMYKDGKYAGVAFHGVPGGQEINSFVLAMYNLAGPGQEISCQTIKEIQKLKKTNIKICVSLSCHYCPKVVTACQRIAILNNEIEGEMLDASLYEELISKFKIERVPLMIINDQDVYAGSKTMEEIIEIIKNSEKNNETYTHCTK